MPASYNIKTNFGAVGNGSTDDGQAFIDFNTAARSDTGLVTLTVPAGTYSIQRGVGGFADGIKQLLVVGAGIDASIIKNDRAGGLNAFAVGCAAAVQYDNVHSAMFQTVAVGATSITLVDASKASLFNVNDWVLLAGLDLQGLYSLTSGYGDPPNPQFYEYKKITSISGGVITFSAPLTLSYKSTWPRFNSGDAGHSDNGGPATIYALNQSWNTEVELRDLTINNPTNQTSCKGRSVTLTRVKSTSTGNNFALYPGETGTFTATGCSWPNAFIEIDKLTETSIFDNCSLYEIDCQSPTGTLILRNGCTVSNIVQGTTRNAYFSDSTIAELRVGAYAYGASQSFSATNCAISAFSADGHNTSGTEGGGAGLQSVFSMSAGIISVPKASNANFNLLRWAVPGTVCFWGSDAEAETSFRVSDVYEDVSNFYVRTSLSGGFPNIPTGGPSKIRTHPSPSFTMVNCTGCAEVVDLSQAPAGRPLYSWSRRTYTKSDTPSTIGSPKLWGKISNLSFNVTSVYAGVGALTFNAISEFNNWVVVKPSDYSAASYGVVINVKAAGERIVTPSGVTGAQAGDGTLTIPEAYWLTGTSSGLRFSADVSASSDFSVTVALQTDQGFLTGTPLRIRLH